MVGIDSLVMLFSPSVGIRSEWHQASLQQVMGQWCSRKKRAIRSQAVQELSYSFHSVTIH
jgi:hypothetical protein